MWFSSQTYDGKPACAIDTFNIINFLFIRIPGFNKRDWERSSKSLLFFLFQHIFVRATSNPSFPSSLQGNHFQIIVLYCWNCKIQSHISLQPCNTPAWVRKNRPARNDCELAVVSGKRLDVMRNWEKHLIIWLQIPRTFFDVVCHWIRKQKRSFISKPLWWATILPSVIMTDCFFTLNNSSLICYLS